MADAGVAAAGPSAGSSVAAAIAFGHRVLSEAGCDSPRLDAELLLAAVLQVGRERLIIDRDAPLDAASAADFTQLLARRAAREPVAYILGRRDFRYLTLAVDPRVLIPRPETELLVEVGLGLVSGARVLDVGTGSGAVALALKHERPDLDVSGVDVSEDALAVARGNAAALGLDVSFAVGDLLAGREGGHDGFDRLDRFDRFDRFDAVLANLPYVTDGAALEPEIARYEPAGALFGGADGLDLVRRLVAEVASLSPGVSLLALEIDPDQAGAVSDLVAAAGFDSVEVVADLAGLARVVVGRRLPSGRLPALGRSVGESS